MLLHLVSKKIFSATALFVCHYDTAFCVGCQDILKKIFLRQRRNARDFLICGQDLTFSWRIDTILTRHWAVSDWVSCYYISAFVLLYVYLLTRRSIYKCPQQQTSKPRSTRPNSIAKRASPCTVSWKKRFCAMLQDGALTHGEQLPSEAEMMEQFGVSRTTVRLALKELEGKGLICRERGRGHYVSRTKIEHPATVVTSFTEDIANRGERPGSITLFAEPIFSLAHAGGQAAHLPAGAGHQAGTRAHCRRRAGGPAHTHLVGALVPGLDLEELKKNDISLYSILRRELGLSWGEAHRDPGGAAGRRAPAPPAAFAQGRACAVHRTL